MTSNPLTSSPPLSFAGRSSSRRPGRVRDRLARPLCALLLLALLLPACGRRHPKPDPVDQHLNEMRRAVQKENPEAALAAIDAAIAEQPVNAELSLIKARLLFDFARYADAAATAAKAADLAEEAQARARIAARNARDLETPEEREDARDEAKRAHGEARGHEAHARFVRAAALRSEGRDGEADDAFAGAMDAFDRLSQQPPGEDEAEKAQAELSALLHKAVIQRLRGHREAAAFEIRKIAAKFDTWQGERYWIELLTSDDAERRLYDTMVSDDQ